MSARQTDKGSDLDPSRRQGTGGAPSSRRRRNRDPSNNVTGGTFSGGVGPGGKINAPQAYAGERIYQSKDTQSKLRLCSIVYYLQSSVCVHDRSLIMFSGTCLVPLNLNDRGSAN